LPPRHEGTKVHQGFIKKFSLGALVAIYNFLPGNGKTFVLGNHIQLGE